MALKIWLPLNGSLENKGISDVTVTNNGATVDNNGKIGKCYKTNAAGTIYTHNINLKLGLNFSIAFWLRIDAFQSTWNNFFTLDYDGNHYMGMCYNQSTSGRIGWHIRVDNTSGTATYIYDNYGFDGLSTNTWYHIGLVLENGTVGKMYLNGTLVSSKNTSFQFPNPNYSRLILGSKNYNSSYSACSLNDFRIYDHALSAKEVKEISQGLVLHYKLDGWCGGAGENLYNGTKDFSGSWDNGSSWTVSTEKYNGFAVKEKSSGWGGLAQKN